MSGTILGWILAIAIGIPMVIVGTWLLLRRYPR